MTMKVRLVSGLPPAHPAHGFAREFDGFGFLTPSIRPRRRICQHRLDSNSRLTMAEAQELPDVRLRPSYLQRYTALRRNQSAASHHCGSRRGWSGGSAGAAGASTTRMSGTGTRCRSGGGRALPARGAAAASTTTSRTRTTSRRPDAWLRKLGAGNGVRGMQRRCVASTVDRVRRVPRRSFLSFELPLCLAHRVSLRLIDIP